MEDSKMLLFVVGNGMRGRSLSSWLELKAQFVAVARTMPGWYRMMLFDDVVRDAVLARRAVHEISGSPEISSTALIAVTGEVWSLPTEICGKFLVTMDPLLVLGWIRLEDGSQILSLLLDTPTHTYVDITEQCNGSWASFPLYIEVKEQSVDHDVSSLGEISYTSPSTEGNASFY
jgi:hypothetical protein